MVLDELRVALPGSSPGDSDLPEQVVEAIDALGHGPDAAASLLDACIRTLRAVEHVSPTRFRAASTMTRALLSEWLPRRYGGSPRVRKLVLGNDRRRNDYPDLEVATNNLIIAEVDVASIDGRPLDLSIVDGELMGRACLRAGLAPARIGMDDEVHWMADEISRQLSADQSLRPRRRMTKWANEVLERSESRYYLAVRKSVPTKTLMELRRLFPTLRFVVLTMVSSREQNSIAASIHRIFESRDELQPPR